MSLQTKPWVFCPSNTPVDALVYPQYKEADGSGKTTVGPSGSSTERILQIPWVAYPQFLDDLLGNAIISSGSPVGSCLTRTIPDEHPYLLEFYAVNANVEGKSIYGTVGSEDGDNFEYIKYKFAQVTVSYQRLPFDVLSDADTEAKGDPTKPGLELFRNVIRTGGYAAEFIQIANQGSAYRWKSRLVGNNTMNYPPNKNSGLGELNYTWIQVPATQVDPWHIPTYKTIQTCVGKVNSLPFDEYTEGTVLFLGADWKLTTPRIQIGGNPMVTTQLSGANTIKQQYYDISYKFAVRNNGSTWPSSGGPWPFGDFPSGNAIVADHNFIYDPMFNRYDLITSGADAGKLPTAYNGSLVIQSFPLYGATDLNQLFVLCGD